MKKVLVVYNNLKNGGVENVIMNITRNLHEEVIFDLAVFDNCDTQMYNDRFRELGGTIHKIKVPDFNNVILNRLLGAIPKKNGLLKLLKENDYCAVHSHQSFESGVVMVAANSARVPVRITHSHFSGYPARNPLDKMIRKFNRNLINKYSTHKVGCCEAAYNWLYGENEDKKHIIYNGVDLSKFSGNRILNKEGIINFINVGRYVESKNHLFLIETFYNLTKFRNNIKLTLIGYGDLENEIKNKIKEFGLMDKVEMLSGSTEVSNVLKNMDYCIFPSKREGFSVSLVEMQAMKIPCFISDTITKESNLGICEYINLEKGPIYWAEYINNYIENDNGKRDVNLQKVDNKFIAKSFKEMYKL